MRRNRGFNFRKACRKLNPALAAKLDPIPPLERDLRDRLNSIEVEIDWISRRRNAHVGSDRLAALIAERQGLNRRTPRQLTTEKRGESDGSKP